MFIDCRCSPSNSISLQWKPCKKQLTEIKTETEPTELEALIADKDISIKQMF